MEKKFTIIRTDGRGGKHVSYRSAESFVERIASDDATRSVERYRNSFDFYAPDELPRLQKVYPVATFTLDNQGNMLLKQLNGLHHLHIGRLDGPSDVRRVKEQVAMLPMTFMALEGADARSVELLVRVTSGPAGQAYESVSLREAERFCRAAQAMTEKLYVALFPSLSSCNCRSDNDDAEEPNPLYSSFLMTVDADPYYNPMASPLTVSPSYLQEPVNEPTQLPAATCDQAEGYRPSDDVAGMIRFLQTNYRFRFNTMMGYTEYRPRTRFSGSWVAVDERAVNTFVLKARLHNLAVWNRDVKRFLESSMIDSYNPVTSFLWEVRGQWDGKDHIGELAHRVPTDNPFWQQWFRTWFIAMVAQWINHNRHYGNSLAPLLISQQGYRKSTFCKMIIPPQLQWGYIDDLILSEKKQVLQMMSQMLLINLDEFNSVSRRLQEGFVKNIIQLATVKVKRPYGKHVEDFPRTASFIATSNMSDILTDPSGSRRFFGIVVKAPIETDRPINYTQLYAQAMAAIDNRDPYWLNEEQTQQLMRSNLEFQQKPDAQLYFESYFEPTDNETDGVYLTSTDIYMQLCKLVGSQLKQTSLTRFGRFLSNIPGIKRKHSNRGAVYLVKPIKK